MCCSLVNCVVIVIICVVLVNCVFLVVICVVLLLIVLFGYKFCPCC